MKMKKILSTVTALALAVTSLPNLDLSVFAENVTVTLKENVYSVALEKWVEESSGNTGLYPLASNNKVDIEGITPGVTTVEELADDFAITFNGFNIIRWGNDSFSDGDLWQCVEIQTTDDYWYSINAGQTATIAEMKAADERFTGTITAVNLNIGVTEEGAANTAFTAMNQGDIFEIFFKGDVRSSLTVSLNDGVTSMNAGKWVDSENGASDIGPWGDTNILSITDKNGNSVIGKTLGELAAEYNEIVYEAPVIYGTDGLYGFTKDMLEQNYTLVAGGMEDYSNLSIDRLIDRVGEDSSISEIRWNCRLADTAEANAVFSAMNEGDNFTVYFTENIRTAVTVKLKDYVSEIPATRYVNSDGSTGISALMPLSADAVNADGNSIIGMTLGEAAELYNRFAFEPLNITITGNKTIPAEYIGYSYNIVLGDEASRNSAYAESLDELINNGCNPDEPIYGFELSCYITNNGETNAEILNLVPEIDVFYIKVKEDNRDVLNVVLKDNVYDISLSKYAEDWGTGLSLTSYGYADLIDSQGNSVIGKTLGELSQNYKRFEIVPFITKTTPVESRTGITFDMICQSFDVTVGDTSLDARGYSIDLLKELYGENTTINGFNYNCWFNDQTYGNDPAFTEMAAGETVNFIIKEDNRLSLNASFNGSADYAELGMWKLDDGSDSGFAPMTEGLLNLCDSEGNSVVGKTLGELSETYNNIILTPATIYSTNSITGITPEMLFQNCNIKVDGCDNPGVTSLSQLIGMYGTDGVITAAELNIGILDEYKNNEAFTSVEMDTDSAVFKVFFTENPNTKTLLNVGYNEAITRGVSTKWIDTSNGDSDLPLETKGLLTLNDANGSSVFGMTLGELAEKYTDIQFNNVPLTGIYSETGLTINDFGQWYYLVINGENVWNTQPFSTLAETYGADAVLNSIELNCFVTDEARATEAYTSIPDGGKVYLFFNNATPGPENRTALYTSHNTSIREAVVKKFEDAETGNIGIETVTKNIIDVKDNEGNSIFGKTLGELAAKYTEVFFNNINISDVTGAEGLEVYDFNQWYYTVIDGQITWDGANFDDLAAKYGSDAVLESVQLSFNVNEDVFTKDAFVNLPAGSEITISLDERYSINIELNEGVTCATIVKDVNEEGIYGSHAETTGVLNAYDRNGNSIFGKTLGELSETIKELTFYPMLDIYSIDEETGFTAEMISQWYYYIIDGQPQWEYGTFDELISTFGENAVLDSVEWSGALAEDYLTNEYYVNMNVGNSFNVYFSESIDTRYPIIASFSGNVSEVVLTKWINEETGATGMATQSTGLLELTGWDGRTVFGKTLGELAERYTEITFMPIGYTGIDSATGLTTDDFNEWFCLVIDGETVWDVQPIDVLVETYGADAVLTSVEWNGNINTASTTKEEYTSIAAGESVTLYFNAPGKAVVEISCNDYIPMYYDSWGKNIYISDYEMQYPGDIVLGQTTIAEFSEKYDELCLGDYTIYDVFGNDVKPDDIGLSLTVVIGAENGEEFSISYVNNRIPVSELPVTNQSFGITTDSVIKNIYISLNYDRRNTPDSLKNFGNGDISLIYLTDTETRPAVYAEYNDIVSSAQFDICTNDDGTHYAYADVQAAYDIDGVVLNETTLGELAEMYHTIVMGNVNFVSFTDGNNLINPWSQITLSVDEYQWTGLSRIISTDALVAEFGADAVIREIWTGHSFDGEQIESIVNEKGSEYQFNGFFKETSDTPFVITPVDVQCLTLNEKGEYFLDYSTYTFPNSDLLQGETTLKQFFDVYNSIQLGEYTIYRVEGGNAAKEDIVFGLDVCTVNENGEEIWYFSVEDITLDYLINLGASTNDIITNVGVGIDYDQENLPESFVNMEANEKNYIFLTEDEREIAKAKYNDVAFSVNAQVINDEFRGTVGYATSECALSIPGVITEQTTLGELAEMYSIVAIDDIEYVDYSENLGTVYADNNVILCVGDNWEWTDSSRFLLTDNLVEMYGKDTVIKQVLIESYFASDVIYNIDAEETPDYVFTAYLKEDNRKPITVDRDCAYFEGIGIYTTEWNNTGFEAGSDIITGLEQLRENGIVTLRDLLNAYSTVTISGYELISTNSDLDLAAFLASPFIKTENFSSWGWKCGNVPFPEDGALDLTFYVEDLLSSADYIPYLDEEITEFGIFIGAEISEETYEKYKDDEDIVIYFEKVNTVPQNLKAELDGNNVVLTWNSVVRNVKYRVQQSTDNKSWSTLDYPTSATYTVKNLEAGKTYYFRVIAYVDGAWRDPSSTVQATVKALAPENLKAVAGDTVVTLTWDKLAGATKYRLQRSTNGTSWSTIAYPTTETYTAKSLTNGTKYYFRVLAYVDGALTDASNVVNATPKGNIIPQNLKATAGDGTVTLTWDKVNGVVKYRLQHYVSNTWSTIAYPTTETYTVKNLKNGGKYVYRVLAYVGGEWSAASAKVLAVPVSATIPQNLKATAGDGTVKLTWNKVNGVVKYRVQHYVSNTWSTIAYPTTETYTVKNLTNGGKYVYRVLAYVDGKWSDASEKVLATPFSATTPQNVKGVAGDKSAKLTWNKVNGAVKYRVQYYSASGWTSIAYPTTNSYTVTGLKNGGKYVYRILAYVDGKWSDASAKVQVIPQA